MARAVLLDPPKGLPVATVLAPKRTTMEATRIRANRAPPLIQSVPVDGSVQKVIVRTRK